MAISTLVVHERLGTWARHLRPRLNGWPVRVVETRSSGDLETALAGAVCPLLVVDLANRPRAGLDDLDRAIRLAPDALALVLDPNSHDGVRLLALEIGAAHVLSGPTTPPAVAGLVCRWLCLSQKRAETAGWSGSAPPPADPEPWNWLTPLINSWPSGQRPAR